MTAIMQLFVVIEVQLLNVFPPSLIVLTKQGGSDILTHIMPLIKPHRHERHHTIKKLKVCNLQSIFFHLGYSTTCTLS